MHKITLIALFILVAGPLCAKAQASEQEKSLCSEESSKRLAKLSLHGETRFSELKFDLDSCTASAVDFAEIGSDRKGGRHRRKKQMRTASSVNSGPQMGNLLTMRGMAKEKNGWREIVVHCGVHKNKISTFTYELLSMNPAPAQADKQ